MNIEADGVTYEPWSDRGCVGYKVTSTEGEVSYIYLNPSSETDDGRPNVFLYKGSMGDPAHDEPVTFEYV